MKRQLEPGGSHPHFGEREPIGILPVLGNSLYAQRKRGSICDSSLKTLRSAGPVTPSYLTSSPTPSTTSSSTSFHTPTPTPLTPHADRGIAPSEDRASCDACAAVLSVRPGLFSPCLRVCLVAGPTVGTLLRRVFPARSVELEIRRRAPRHHPRASAADGVRGGVRHAGPAAVLSPRCRPHRLCWVDPRSPPGRQPHQHEERAV